MPANIIWLDFSIHVPYSGNWIAYQSLETLSITVIELGAQI